MKTSSTSSALSNVKTSLIKLIDCNLFQSLPDMKVVSITQDKIKFIVDSKADKTKRKQKMSIETSHHMTLNQHDGNDDNILLAKAIVATRKWTTKLKQNSSVLIFTLYAPVLDAHLKATLSSLEQTNMDLSFIVLDDDCNLDTNAFQKSLEDQNYSTVINCFTIFSSTSEVMQRMKHALVPLIPTRQIILQPQQEEGTSSASSSSSSSSSSASSSSSSSSSSSTSGSTSSLRLNGSYSCLKENFNMSSRPLVLLPLRRVLLGSIQPDYLTNSMYVCPNQDQITLEERDSCVVDFCTLLNSMTSTSSTTNNALVERTGLLLQDRQNTNDLYLLVPIDSSPKIAAGTLWKLKSWGEMAPKPTMSSYCHTLSTNEFVADINKLPLSTFDPLNRMGQQCSNK